MIFQLCNLLKRYGILLSLWFISYKCTWWSPIRCDRILLFSLLRTYNLQIVLLFKLLNRERALWLQVVFLKPCRWLPTNYGRLKLEMLFFAFGGIELPLTQELAWGTSTVDVLSGDRIWSVQFGIVARLTVDMKFGWGTEDQRVVVVVRKSCLGLHIVWFYNKNS